MSLSRSSNAVLGKILKSLAETWAQTCTRWGIAPIPLIEGAALWIGWTGLTWLAFALSLFVVEVGERGDVSLLEGLIGGSLIGFAQWLIIGRHIKRAHQWIAVSALCWGALGLLHIGAVGWIAPDTMNLMVRVLFGLFYGFYVGLVLGVGQWWVMRRSIVSAWRWILLSAGIWAVAIAFGWLLGGVLRLASNLFVSEVIGLAAAWGIIAALSGVAIVGMLYQQDNRAKVN